MFPEKVFEAWLEELQEQGVACIYGRWQVGSSGKKHPAYDDRVLGHRRRATSATDVARRLFGGAGKGESAGADTATGLPRLATLLAESYEGLWLGLEDW